MYIIENYLVDVGLVQIICVYYKMNNEIKFKPVKKNELNDEIFKNNFGLNQKFIISKL